jgi:AraC-like DNA-binding protein
MKSFLWQTKPQQVPFLINRQSELVFRWHHHDYWEIFGVVAGGGQMLIGDCHRLLQPGEVYVVGPRLPHAFFALAEQGSAQFSGDFFVFAIDLDALAPLCNADALDAWRQAGCGGLCYRGQAAEDVLDLFRQSEKQSGLMRSITALQAIEQLMNSPCPERLTRLQFPDGISENDTDRVQNILKYLHDHFAESLRLPDLAGRVGISEKTLSRIFKQSTGQTVITYLNRLRVFAACQQLVGADQPVTQIAFDCGFGSLPTFNRMFSRYEGMTPMEYRKEREIRR